MMSDVMREIDDDMRQQRLRDFWVENRAWIIGGIVLAIVMTAGLSFWRQHTLNRNAQATYELFSAMDRADEAALGALAETGKGSHGALAAFLAAGIHAQKGESAEAAVVYDRIATTRGLDRVYRDLATLLSVSHRIDAGDAQQLHAALKPLTSAKNIWRFSALELQALLFARENKMADAAAALTTLIGDDAAPAEVRARATTLRALYLEAAGSETVR
ncbi:MAG: tetratricopeptide repeat protein [Alphaproteobacteria bacterium]|nr:tetratricopeptide repeat protein [Alphaproteobacteria bacterium]